MRVPVGVRVAEGALGGGVAVGVGVGVGLPTGGDADPTTAFSVTALAPTTTLKPTPGTLGNCIEVKFPVTVPFGAVKMMKLSPTLGTKPPKRSATSAPLSDAVEFVPLS